MSKITAAGVFVGLIGRDAMTSIGSSEAGASFASIAFAYTRA
ncbi:MULTISPECIES: hypothetical protein [unclassified Burkholderia]|nr:MULTISPECIES: hypothetical protein [unclassified Burkholderia]